MAALRSLTAADADAAVALWEAAGLTRPWNPPHTDFDRAIAGPDSAVLGLLDADGMVGTVMVGHDGHRGWMYYLAVAPECRREGLGRMLVEAAEAWIGERGIVKAQLMVRADNADAAGFYRALGYQLQDAAVLGRRLDGAARPTG
ncbi:GNAT family acetyltransferase [Agrococcus beijingensis]|uniref:GNAT family acetyltransferase n=1 Tax=Agrococcus beijingensis TaxID=3068634 RepID=UPI002740F4FD|nr:GNAT family acetyltransferase [Agrococcus sp. REN33]